MPVDTNPSRKEDTAAKSVLDSADAALTPSLDERQQQMYRLAEIFADIFETLQYERTLTASKMEHAA